LLGNLALLDGIEGSEQFDDLSLGLGYSASLARSECSNVSLRQI
jgi:hypothetical protein